MSFFNPSEFANLHFEFTGNRIDHWDQYDSVDDSVKKWIDSLYMDKICFKCLISFKESDTLGSLPCLTHYGTYTVNGWTCCKLGINSKGCIPCVHTTQNNLKFTPTSRLEIPNHDIIKIPDDVLNTSIQRGKIYGTFEQTTKSICFYNMDRTKLKLLETHSHFLSFREGHDLVNYGKLGVFKRPYESSSHRLFNERFGHMIDHTKTFF